MTDLTFEQFANRIESSWSGQVEVNELPQLISYTAYLEGEVAKVLPRDYKEQKFFEKDLEPLCKQLSIECQVAAQLFAIRFAWLGVFETYVNLKIDNGEQNTIVGEDSVKCVNDYLILNSRFWTQHPGVSEVVGLLNAKRYLEKKETQDKRKQHLVNCENPEFVALLHKEREQNLDDIEFCIDEFDLEENKFKSVEEANAWYAQLDINKAQRKISELKQEIEKLGTVMTQSERVIRRYKTTCHQDKTSKVKGRPVSDEFRVNVGKRFVSKWVRSLMEILEVKSCQKLEQLISPYSTKLDPSRDSRGEQGITVPSKATERNWRRWLNGDAIPNYNTFVILMSTKIEFGKYSGKLLQEIPTTPDSSRLQALLRFI